MILDAFDEAVKNAMRHWRYPADASKPRRKACDTVEVGLRD